MSETQPPPKFADLLYAYAREHDMINRSGRRAGDVKQTELARAFGTEQQNIQRWMKGTIPQEVRWPEVARILGVTVAELERASKATVGADVRHQNDDTLSALSARVEALEQSEARRNAEFLAHVRFIERLLS